MGPIIFRSTASLFLLPPHPVRLGLPLHSETPHQSLRSSAAHPESAEDAPSGIVPRPNGDETSPFANARLGEKNFTFGTRKCRSSTMTRHLSRSWTRLRLHPVPGIKAPSSSFFQGLRAGRRSLFSALPFAFLPSFFFFCLDVC